MYLSMSCHLTVHQSLDVRLDFPALLHVLLGLGQPLGARVGSRGRPRGLSLQQLLLVVRDVADQDVREVEVLGRV